jgi:hypothetical protein
MKPWRMWVLVFFIVIATAVLIGLLPITLGTGSNETKMKITENRLRVLAERFTSIKNEGSKLPDQVDKADLKLMWCEPGQEIYRLDKFDSDSWFLAIPHPTKPAEFLAVDADGKIVTLPSQSVTQQK